VQSQASLAQPPCKIADGCKLVQADALGRQTNLIAELGVDGSLLRDEEPVSARPDRRSIRHLVLVAPVERGRTNLAPDSIDESRPCRVEDGPIAAPPSSSPWSVRYVVGSLAERIRDGVFASSITHRIALSSASSSISLPSTRAILRQRRPWKCLKSVCNLGRHETDPLCFGWHPDGHGGARV
jgi:hypothetical protein